MKRKDEGLVYLDSLPGPDEYWDLFNTTGWNSEYGFTREELGASLERSWYCISVYREGCLVGFGRIISDGIHHALIADLIVKPGNQKQGIGREILERLLVQCRRERIRDIQLFAARGKGAFYEHLGFIRRDEEAPGMEYLYDISR